VLTCCFRFIRNPATIKPDEERRNNWTKVLVHISGIACNQLSAKPVFSDRRIQKGSNLP
jgi:hypothetical protein